MDIKPIKTESDYQIALQRLEVLFDAPDPIEAIKIRMEEMNIKQADLIPVLGGKNRVSEILNRRRRLTLGMIRGLSDYLNLSVYVLIKEYQLDR